MAERRDDAPDKAREEFFSEASELVDGFGRHLLALEESVENGHGPDPETLNDIFRGVHTLKGLSGLFGAATLSGLSHELENLLDDLRLGRIPLSTAVLDLLFDAVELYGRILSALKGEEAEPREEVLTLLASLAAVSNERSGNVAFIAEYELDPETLGVLTEYEEHRLRSNLQAGLALYRLKAKFPLATIDSALEELKLRVRPVGEIITYLPTGDGGDLDAIDLEILVASRSAAAELRQAVDSDAVSVDEVKKRDLSQARTPSAPRVGERTDDSAMELPDGRETPPPPPVEDDEPAHASMHPAPHATEAVVMPAAAGGRDISLRSVSQTVRVDIRKLDRLMNALGELSLVRGALLRYAEKLRSEPGTRRLGMDLLGVHRAFERQLAQMQSGILEVRMVPLGQVFDKLARIVRQVSREQNKSVHFVVTGGETEIDKLIVEELSDPLLHMIRNAIDHGIEPIPERAAAGKPDTGTVALNAYQQGNHVVIEVEDDGRGIDPHAVLHKAVTMGLVSMEEAKSFSLEEAVSLVFMQGFSTRDTATAMSGRGIGMDIVKTRIAKLGGLVDIVSEVQIGTKITLTLPVTLAIVGVLTFVVEATVYCMPLSSMEEAVVFDSALVREVDGREVMTHRGVTLPVVRLARLFSEPPAPQRATKQFLIVARVGTRRLGMVVDRLIEQQDVVIKALGRTLAHVRGFAGATDLGDQRVALILDVPSLIEECLTAAEGRRGNEAALAFRFGERS